MSSPKGYILTNTVSHTRFTPFRHTFKYTTIAVLVEISALEDSKLDTPFLFGYNKRWRSLCSLRSDGYLFPSSDIDKMGIREKLDVLLRKGDYGNVLDGPTEIWMLSMPSYFGFEGINPLTVYLIYAVANGHESIKELKLVLFEVHNTFGEGHVYFMRPGVEEDFSSKHMYDHQWSFPRAFHVSPFNDRKGWYTVSIKLPQLPDKDVGPEEGNPKPVISIQLREPSTETSQPGIPGQTKLTATLRTTNALPLPSARNLLFTLISYPLELFLSMPRILYQAAILHYRKGDKQSDLKVYLRPEPFLTPTSFALPFQAANAEIQIYPATGAGFTIRRRPLGILAYWAKERVREFLRTRVRTISRKTEDNIAETAVVLVEPDASTDAEEWFLPSFASKPTAGKELGNHHNRGTRVVRITPLSPEFFELLLTAPSAGMVLFAGGVVDSSDSSSETNAKFNSYSRILNNDRGPNDALFVVNDPELFLDVFNGTYDAPTRPPSRPSFVQSLRLSVLPLSLVTILQSARASQLDPGAGGEQEPQSDELTRLFHVPETHFLDSPCPPYSLSARSPFSFLSTIQEFFLNFRLLSLLMTILTLSTLEPYIFALFRARMQSGTETWSAKIWERVERRIHLARDPVKKD
ncbi:hypothetical protein F5050DRAFT_1891270 [Lentinula boryana]|uniref:Uncharacterized protein n=1 Tax=Lentinula boryana TaxID=40481 RepID=A0ABQ8QS77_9AGAR|nr:hypothetical protein F5050DRAFT_1891270 [Lentinula boryana]